MSSPEVKARRVRSSLRALLESAVDYAGTFPPARLELEAALSEYAAQRAGPHAWMLGAFVLPAAKLADFEKLAPRFLGPPAPGPWPLSVILSAEPAADLERVESFARRWRDRVKVASVEAPPLDAARVRETVARVPQGVEAFFEAPLVPDPNGPSDIEGSGPEGRGLEGRLAAIAAAGAAVKVRTGGTSAEAFPGAVELSRFLVACSRAGLSFKATAGLHHPFRSTRTLADGGGAREVTQHGFLNLAAAACLLHAGKIAPDDVPAALEERSPDAFQFREDAVVWRDRQLLAKDTALARRGFFRSFGSCSFQEPLADLEEHGLL